VFCLNTLTSEWKKLFALEAPSPRSMHSMTQIGIQKKVLLFGGYSKVNNKLLNDMHLLDLTEVKFENKSPDLPGAMWTNIEQHGSIPSPRRGAILRKFPED